MAQGATYSRRQVLAAIGGLVAGGIIGAGVTAALLGRQGGAAERTVTVTETVTTTVGAGGAGQQAAGQVPEKPLKVGLVTFVSGPGAVVGEHTKNAAELVRDWINADGGLLGKRKIEMLFLDEATGPENVVKTVTRWVREEGVELVVCCTSSGTMVALAPVIEKELQVPCLAPDATSARIFEEIDPNPRFLFRVGNYDAMENIALAEVVADVLPDVKTVINISPDYEFGRDSWRRFITALRKLKPDIEVVDELWPPLFRVPDYTPYIQKIASARPDVVYSSLWGGDVLNFLRQSVAQGLWRNVRLGVFSVLATAEMPPDTPEGLLVGARSWWPFWPRKWPLTEMFVKEYVDRFGKYPYHTAFTGFTPLWVYAAAVEKAFDLSGKYPDTDMLIRALEDIMVPTIGGYRSFRREDHQMMGATIIGFTKRSAQYNFAVLDRIRPVAPEDAAPPPGIKTDDWIASW